MRTLALLVLVAGCGSSPEGERDPADPPCAELTFHADADGDGRGDPAAPTAACVAPAGHVADGTDCDDAEAAVHPGQTERCNLVDDDCDGVTDEDLLVTAWSDEDQDGWGELPVEACEVPPGHATLGGDCDDGDPARFPGAPETCDEVDQDCDGVVDEGVGVPQWPDADGDGYGDEAANAVPTCGEPAGMATNGLDCDDAHAEAFPGSPERCDELDGDCDGLVDEGVTTPYFADGDGDGYGDPTQRTDACALPPAHAANALDCDDGDPGAHFGASEVCDGGDNDCDGAVDEQVALSWYVDGDGDGRGDPATLEVGCAPPVGVVYVDGDCDDGDAGVHEGAFEVCDAVDQDCDGVADEGLTVSWWPDLDADGWGDPVGMAEGCVAPPATTGRPGDCDDLRADVYTSAPELCDDADNDCDGFADDGILVSWWPDTDGDGAGDAAVAGTLTCSGAPASTVANARDCDDTRADVYTGASEVCDGDDNDCDNVADDGLLISWWPDGDGDGWGDLEAAPLQICTAPPPDMVSRAGDCDDLDPTAYSGALEACDAVDDDCDGVVDDGVQSLYWSDSDADGWGDPLAPFVRGCAPPADTVATGGDCDDLDPLVGGDSCAPDVPAGFTTWGADDARTGYQPGFLGGGALTPMWSTSLGTSVEPPTIAQATVYLVAQDSPDDRLVALDLITGVTSFDVAVDESSGPSAATWESGVLYLQRIDSSDAHLVAYDAGVGTELWRTSMSAQWDHYLSPLVMDGRVFTGGGTYGGVYGFNGSTGAQLWFKSDEMRDEWTPVGYGGVLYTLIGDDFEARSVTTGNTNWTVVLPESPAAPYTQDTVPAIADDLAVAVAGDDLVGVSLTSRSIVWRLVDGFEGSPAIGGGLVYAVRDGQLAQVDAADGYLVRMLAGDGALAGKPVVTDDAVIAASDDSTFVWRPWDGGLVDELLVGGELAVGEGALVVVDGASVRAYEWQ